PPTPGLVDQFFNTSTGDGDGAEIDARGPWNQGKDVEFVNAPALATLHDGDGRGPADTLTIDDRTTSSAHEPQLIEELLVDRLCELIHAEGQLIRALPQISQAARSLSLKLALENHFEETTRHVERLLEVFALVGENPHATLSPGMKGLIDEAEQAIDSGDEQDDVAADLALIAVTQKIEHYEIAAYETARTMASQIALPAVTQLLNQSLAEEESANSLMAQLQRELISQSRPTTTKAPKHTA